MTLEQAIELGRRMMACEGFEWRPGMRHFGGIVSDDEWMYGRVPVAQVPDPRDPGTVGHALAMMRDAVTPDAIGARVPHLVATLSVERAESVTEWCVRSGMTFYPPAAARAEAVVAAWEALS